MGFIASYKQLEKLCGEIFNSSPHGVTEYIEEMERTPNGKFYVEKWGEDYKALKHYRYIRNKIVHEPNCNEENMCTAKDTQWLENFYFRIMNQQDPLSLYEKATVTYKKTKSKYKKTTPTQKNTEFYRPNKKQSDSDYFIPLVFIATILVFVMFIWFVLKP